MLNDKKMTEEELADFIRWYWKEIDEKPYDITPEEIIKFYKIAE